MLAGRDYRGALYGVSSFVQLVYRGDTAASPWATRRCATGLPPVRWVHLYLPGRDQLGFARRYFRDFLLRYKYNGVVLELGGGVRLDSHPEISVGWRRTVSEWYAHGETIDKLGEGIPLGTGAPLRGLAAHRRRRRRLRREGRRAPAGGVGGGLRARDRPEIQSLSHSYYIASAHRDVAEDPDMPWPDSYCPSNPESYRILFEVMDEYLELMRPRRVHIGHDEWRAGAFCPRCRGKDTGSSTPRTC